ncbi:MAG: cation transporter [Cytophagales bacterium]|nr:MAG: cation transporter [Cytophagales bacterium]TAF61949.1 MAG: cation transporter [Cytophagales bacterium]
MKFLATCFFMLLCWSFDASAQTSTKKSPWKQISIATSSQCGACKERIETAFYKQKGVKKAVLDLKKDVLKVQYNVNQVSEAELKALLQKIGYDADNLPADPVAYEKLPACCKKGGHD